MSAKESDDAEYARIWKSIFPCVDKCILSHFRNVQEMLHCSRWCIVHVTCRNIILRHMQVLHVDDPHEFDKAVYWKVMKEGWDRDPKWRCICAFFLAAAMEIDMVSRCTEERFKKAESVGRGDQPVFDEAKYRDFMDIVRSIERMYQETHNKVSAMHHDMGEIHRKVSALHHGKDGGHDPLKTSSTGYYPHASGSSAHVTQSGASKSGLDINNLFQKMLDIMRSEPPRDKSSQKTSKNKSKENASDDDNHYRNNSSTYARGRRSLPTSEYEDDYTRNRNFKVQDSRKQSRSSRGEEYEWP